MIRKEETILAARMKEKYKSEVFPALRDKFQYSNVMEVPKLEKITLNMGLGDTKDNPKLLENLRSYRGSPPLSQRRANPSRTLSCGRA